MKTHSPTFMWYFAPLYLTRFVTQEEWCDTLKNFGGITITRDEEGHVLCTELKGFGLALAQTRHYYAEKYPRKG